MKFPKFRIRATQKPPVLNENETDFAPPFPEEKLVLLGDLHGRVDLLDRFLELRAAEFPDHRLIVLGDMIDRGPDSAEVLRRLQGFDEEKLICLLGNHEEMMLNFLDQPEQNLGWLRHGGLSTLASFGIRGSHNRPKERLQLSQDLRDALGDLNIWLRGLPRLWQSGDLVAVHAGMDPMLPPEKQLDQHLTWGCPTFSREMRGDLLWVAHGHTVVETAHAKSRRIAVDTGAYSTGILSFARIDPNAQGEDRLKFAQINAI